MSELTYAYEQAMLESCGKECPPEPDTWWRFPSIFFGAFAVLIFLGLEVFVIFFGFLSLAAFFIFIV